MSSSSSSSQPPPSPPPKSDLLDTSVSADEPVPVPEHPHVDVEADVGESTDEFSDYESIASSTTSVSSSIYNYQYENGRRYHAYRAGAYLLPNDEAEQDRLDLAHHMFRLALGGDLCVTKLENPQRILDIGTGTGIWAMEMGDLHPAAEIIGTDLSPVQPTWVPPNVRFEIDDATDEWTFPQNHFDFIWARTLAGSIQDWPGLLKKCYDHLKPGGRLEIAEGRANLWFKEGSVAEDSFTYKWLMEWRRLSANLLFDVFPSLQGWAEKLPFENIQTVEKITPMGPWTKDKSLKELGVVFRVQFFEGGMESYTLALFTRVGEWKETEVKVLIAKVLKEMTEKRMHLYTFCSFLTAQKPISAPPS